MVVAFSYCMPCFFANLALTSYVKVPPPPTHSANVAVLGFYRAVVSYEPATPCPVLHVLLLRQFSACSACQYSICLRARYALSSIDGSLRAYATLCPVLSRTLHAICCITLVIIRMSHVNGRTPVPRAGTGPYAFASAVWY
eukprot:232591-Rhodomonas_salina.2